MHDIVYLYHGSSRRNCILSTSSAQMAITGRWLGGGVYTVLMMPNLGHSYCIISSFHNSCVKHFVVLGHPHPSGVNTLTGYRSKALHVCGVWCDWTWNLAMCWDYFRRNISLYILHLMLISCWLVAYFMVKLLIKTGAWPVNAELD